MGVIRIIQARFRVPAARMSLQSRRGPTYYPFWRAIVKNVPALIFGWMTMNWTEGLIKNKAENKKLNNSFFGLPDSVK